MQIHISTNDGVPIYLQIVNQIKYLIAAGRLSPAEEIPPIRVLAEQLLINPNTALISNSNGPESSSKNTARALIFQTLAVRSPEKSG